MKGPKNQKETNTDKQCFLCKKWFSLFQVQRFLPRNRSEVNVCGACVKKSVLEAISKIAS